MTGRGIVGLGLVLAGIGMLATPAESHFVGCPAGQAIRGINFLTRTLVCVSLGTEEIGALQTAVAGLKEQVATLQAENAQQAGAIAALEGQLASLTTLTSPSGLYSILVTDDGIVLQGPGVSIALNQGDPPPGSSPTVTITATTVEVLAGALGIVSDVSTTITSGATTTIESGTHTNVSSGATTNMLSGDATNITGAGIALNGGCLPVARAGDPVSSSGQIGSGSPTVRSC